MLTLKIAENTTFASKALPANTDAQLEQSSRSETLMAQETAKTPKTFPDGKFVDLLISLSWLPFHNTS